MCDVRSCFLLSLCKERGGCMKHCHLFLVAVSLLIHGYTVNATNGSDILQSLYHWAEQNNMHFNSPKLSFLSSFSHRCPSSNLTNINCQAGSHYQRSRYFKSDDLYFSYHIGHVLRIGQRLSGSIIRYFMYSYLMLTLSKCCMVLY